MKLGLFGGSFDPIHYGHLSIAKEALEKFDLDRIDFILAKQNPLKKLIPSEDRIQNLEKAIKEYPQFQISRIELERETPSYSYRTVQYYKEKFPEAEIFWIMGLDSWNTITQWKNYEYLLETLTFIVFARDGYSNTNINLESKVHFVEGKLYRISSTQIREL